MRHVFGWSLPPGVTQRMIDEAAGGYDGQPCDVCGYDVDHCICPECPVCGSYGDPHCYEPSEGEHHGLHRTPDQEEAFALACKRWEEEARQEQEALARLVEEEMRRDDE